MVLWPRLPLVLWLWELLLVLGFWLWVRCRWNPEDVIGCREWFFKQASLYSIGPSKSTGARIAFDTVKQRCLAGCTEGVGEVVYVQNYCTVGLTLQIM